MMLLLLLALTLLGLLFGCGCYLLYVRLMASRRAQRRNERLYRSFVEQTMEGVLLAEVGTLRLIEVNAAASRLLGLTGPCPPTLHDVVRLPQTSLTEALAGIRPGEQHNLGELQQTLPDGRTVQLELSASIISHDERNIVSLMIRDISERKRAEQEIRFHAFHDPLTRLPNRLLFEDRMRVALAQAQRERATLAVLFIDLDNLKEVNDSFGHEMGDALLVEVARRLQANVRGGDTVSRVGGDEFLVLLPSISHPEDTIALCNRLLQALRVPSRVLGRELSARASMGVSLYPQDGVEIRDLVHRADMAMYRAKEQGKDCWQLYNSEMSDHLQGLVETRTCLLQALERNELLLHYQPEVEARTGLLVALEALLRWMRPGQGLLLPADFLAAAEQDGVIAQIGAWVLRTGCAQLRQWREQGLVVPRLAINLSARQLSQPDLAALIRQELEQNGLAPAQLELEVSEDTVMQNPEMVLPVLERLKAVGVSLALDDFGKGYSSLSYLQRFPLDRAKIDCSFIGRLTDSEDSRAIVSSLLRLAHGFGLQAVAEGVNSAAATPFLIENGCELLQGYAVSRPLPADEVRLLLDQGALSTNDRWPITRIVSPS